MYEQMLDRDQLSYHVTKPTRNGNNLIDHISSNLQRNKIRHSEILPCSTINDHAASYIFINLPTNNFEIRYKFIRNLKHVDLETFVKDFKTLPFTSVYSFYETEDCDALGDLVLFVDLKNMKNTHGGELLLVKLQASKHTQPWVFFTFFKLFKWYQIAQNITIILRSNQS